MTVRFTDRLRDIFQIMQMANLMRYQGELMVNRQTDRFLRIPDDSQDRQS